MVTVCPSQFATRRTLFHVLVGCGLLMLKVSRLKLPFFFFQAEDCIRATSVTGVQTCALPICMALSAQGCSEYCSTYMRWTLCRAMAGGTSGGTVPRSSPTSIDL